MPTYPAGMHPHRFALLIVAAAVALTGCATGGDVVQNSGSPTVVETSIPTPTPIPTVDAEAVLPFGGTCAGAITDSEAAGLIGELGNPRTGPELLNSLETPRSAALIGGLSCSWSASNANYLAVDAFPIGVVPASVRAKAIGVVCSDGWCEGAEIAGSTWVNVGALVGKGNDSELAARAAMKIVGSRAGDAASARPGAWSASWWQPVTDCAVLRDAVAEALGDAAIKPGFPTDTLPTGPTVDVLDANGAVVQCSWFDYDRVTGAIVFVQPGIGAPAASLLAEPGVAQVDVTGADHAWFVSVAGQRPRLVAVSGPNRLTVEGLPDEPSATLAAVAAGVLGVLDRP